MAKEMTEKGGEGGGEGTEGVEKKEQLDFCRTHTWRSASFGVSPNLPDKDQAYAWGID